MRKILETPDSANFANSSKSPGLGGRWVFFEICVSCILFTLRRPSAIYYIPPGRAAWIDGLPYTVLTLFLGWWGLPWGFIYTPLVLLRNLTGGCDVTQEIVAPKSSTHD
jgi:hypothetical protein